MVANKPRFGGGIKMATIQTHTPGDSPGTRPSSPLGRFMATTKEEKATPAAEPQSPRYPCPKVESCSKIRTPDAKGKVISKDAREECIVSVQQKDASPNVNILSCFPASCGGNTTGRVANAHNTSCPDPSSLTAAVTKAECCQDTAQDSSASWKNPNAAIRKLAADQGTVSRATIQASEYMNSSQQSGNRSILLPGCSGSTVERSSPHRVAIKTDEYLDLSQPTSAGRNSHIDSSNDPKNESGRSEQKETNCNSLLSSCVNSFDSVMNLLKTFELLEIKAIPRLYTKLNDENKQHLPSFLEGYKNYTALNQKVDVSELCICSPDLEKDITYCKNLFLKDRKGQFYLVIVEESCTVDLKQLKIQLNASRNMSFADEKSLTNILGLKQGEVTPLAVMQESARDVRVVFHESLSFVRQSGMLMAFHPFSPFLQVHLSFPQLDQFVVHCGKTLEILDHSQKQKNILEIEPSTSERSSKDTAGNSKNKEETSTSTKDFKTRGQDKKPPSSTCSADKGENWNPKLDTESTQPREIISPEKEAISCDSKDVHPESITDQNCMHAPVPPLTLERLVEFRDDTKDKMEERKERKFVPDRGEQKERNNSLRSSSANSMDSGHSASVRGGTPTIKLPATEPAKDVKKVIVKSFDRKGKLKSYIKKRTVFKDRNIVAAKETVIHKEFGTFNNTKSLDEKVSDTNEQEFTKATDEATINPSRPASESPERDGETGELYKLSPKKNLPEVDEFYHHLKQFKVQFREVSVSTCTSTEIGPSVGVRCFLFKDKRSNYFQVISHEYYEPDFGRLKKALHPRKKLDLCHPFDIMGIFGVDWQHFSPFAIMSAMAQRNKVHVYLTEKISLPHIILCIQHPFAQGRRIIMTSSQLQHLIGQFSANGVGVVEEKDWLKKYSVMFTQFDNDSVKETVNNLMENDGAPCKEGELKAHSLQSQDDEKIIAPTKTTQKEEVKNNSEKSTFNFHKDYIRRLFNHVRKSFHLLQIKHSQSLLHGLNGAGSSVDDVDLETKSRSAEREETVGIDVRHSSRWDPKTAQGRSGKEQPASRGEGRHPDTTGLPLTLGLNGGEGSPSSSRRHGMDSFPMASIGTGADSPHHPIRVEPGSNSTMFSPKGEQRQGFLHRQPWPSPSLRHPPTDGLSSSSQSAKVDSNPSMTLPEDEEEEEDEEINDCVQFQEEDEKDCVQFEDEDEKDCVQFEDEDENDCVQFEEEDENDCVQFEEEDENDCVQFEDEDENDCVQFEEEDENEEEDRGRPPEDVNVDEASPFFRNSQDKTGISPETIRLHLDKHSVNYTLNTNDTDPTDATGSDVSDDDDNDDDSISQACSTQHIWDESTNTHYVVVGRDLEHVPVKRFCRRFQISNRVYVVSEAGDLMVGTHAGFVFINPFTIFLSSHRDQVERVGINSRGPSFKLVLYSSIYSDLSTKCVFRLTPSGTTLTLSSRDLQAYARSVGMTVLAMP